MRGVMILYRIFSCSVSSCLRSSFKHEILHRFLSFFSNLDTTLAMKQTNMSCRRQSWNTSGSVLRKLGFCCEFLEMNQIILNSMNKAMCSIQNYDNYFKYFVHNDSALSCLIVNSRINYFTT